MLEKERSSYSVEAMTWAVSLVYIHSTLLTYKWKCLFGQLLETTRIQKQIYLQNISNFDLNQGSENYLKNHIII